MAKIDEFRAAYPDVLGDMSDAAIVDLIGQATGGDRQMTAYDLGLDARAYSQNTHFGEDAANYVESGILAIPGIAAGLADTVNPLTYVNDRAYFSEAGDWIANKTGLDPSARMERLAGNMTPATQEARQATQDAEGFLPTLKAYAQNPRAAGGLVLESLPQVVAGGVVGRGLGKAGQLAQGVRGAPALNATGQAVQRVAPFAGEGAVMAGAQFDAALEGGADPRTAGQAALATGVIGAGVAGVGGQIADRLGVEDFTQRFAGVRQAAREGDTRFMVQRGLAPAAARIAAGGVIEAGEEFAQTGAEKVLYNAATGEELTAGLGNALAAGTVAGGIMGVGFNAVARPHRMPKLSDGSIDLTGDTNDLDNFDPQAGNPATGEPLVPQAGDGVGKEFGLVPAAQHAARQAQLDAAFAEEDRVYGAPSGQFDPKLNREITVGELEGREGFTPKDVAARVKARAKNAQVPKKPAMTGQPTTAPIDSKTAPNVEAEDDLITYARNELQGVSGHIFKQGKKSKGQPYGTLTDYVTKLRTLDEAGVQAEYESLTGSTAQRAGWMGGLLKKYAEESGYSLTPESATPAAATPTTETPSVEPPAQPAPQPSVTSTGETDLVAASEQAPGALSTTAPGQPPAGQPVAPAQTASVDPNSVPLDQVDVKAELEAARQQRVAEYEAQKAAEAQQAAAQEAQKAAKKEGPKFERAEISDYAASLFRDRAVDALDDRVQSHVQRKLGKNADPAAVTEATDKLKQALTRAVDQYYGLGQQEQDKAPSYTDLAAYIKQTTGLDISHQVVGTLLKEFDAAFSAMYEQEAANNGLPPVVPRYAADPTRARREDTSTGVNVTGRAIRDEYGNVSTSDGAEEVTVAGREQNKLAQDFGVDNELDAQAAADAADTADIAAMFNVSVADFGDLQSSDKLDSGAGGVGVARASKNIKQLYASALKQTNPTLAEMTDADLDARAHLELQAMVPELRSNFIEVVRAMGVKPERETGRVVAKPAQVESFKNLQEAIQKMGARAMRVKHGDRYVDQIDVPLNQDALAESGTAVASATRDKLAADWGRATSHIGFPVELSALSPELQGEWAEAITELDRLRGSKRFDTLLRDFATELHAQHEQSRAKSVGDARPRPGADGQAREGSAGPGGATQRSEAAGQTGEETGDQSPPSRAEGFQKASTVAIQPKRRRRAPPQAAPAAEGQGVADRKNSRAEGTGTTAEAIDAAITDAIGKGRRANLNVYATIDEAVAAGAASKNDQGVQAWVEKDARGQWQAHFVAENIRPGTELAVFLHEVGAHLGIDGLLTPGQRIQLAGQIKTWANRNDGSQESEIATKALARVKRAQKAGDDRGVDTATSERIAYFIEEAVKAGVNPSALATNTPMGGWFDRLLKMISGALKKIGLGNFDSLTSQELVDLALGAANVALEDNTPANGSKKNSRIEDINPILKGGTDWLMEEAKGGAKQFAENVGLGWLTLDQMAQRYGKDHAPLKGIIDSTAAMDATSKKWMRRAEGIDREWADLPKAANKTMMSVMRAATRAKYDPADPNTQATAAIDHKLNAEWKKLPKEAKKVYTDVRDYYTGVIQESRDFAQQIKNKADPDSKDDALTAYIDALTKRATKPYFPLVRIGQYHIVAKSKEVLALEKKSEQDGKLNAADSKRLGELRKNPNHYRVRVVERRAEAERQAKEWQGQFERTYFNQNLYRSASGRSSVLPETQRLAERLVDMGLKADTIKQISGTYQQLLLDALPEGHALKNQFKREGIHGESEDMRAAFASTAQSQSHMLSRLMHARDIHAGIEDLHKTSEEGNIDARTLYNELQKRTELAYQQYKLPWLAGALTTWSYYGMLGASPAFWAVNLTQVPMVTAPWLSARNGNNFVGTMRDLMKSANLARSMLTWDRLGSSPDTWEFSVRLDEKKMAGKLSKPEQDMITELLDSGLLDFTIGYDLGAISEGSASKIARLTRSINSPTHATEVINRTATAISAFRVAKQQGKSQEAAVEFVKEAVSTTQINYAPTNAARHMQSIGGSRAAARVVFQFYRYQQGMVYLTLSTMKDIFNKSKTAEERKTARDTALGQSFMLASMSGIFGLPFVATGLSIMSVFANIFGDDDKDYDYQRDIRNLMQDYIPWAEQSASKGLPSLLGLDPSKRIGLGDLANPFAYGRVDSRDRGQDVVAQSLFSLGGASMSTVSNIYDAGKAFHDGDFLKMTEKLVPLKMAKDVLKAVDLGTDGLTTSTGEPVLSPKDFSAGDLLLKAAGFAPMKASNYYDRNAAIQGTKNAVEGARQKLITEYAQSILAGDPTRDIMQDITEFNRKHKGREITYSTRRKAIQQRRKNRAARDSGGVLADRANKPYMDAGRFAE